MSPGNTGTIVLWLACGGGMTLDAFRLRACGFVVETLAIWLAWKQNATCKKGSAWERMS
jgi:hypothetical protein